MRWGIATCLYDHAKPWYCRSLVETYINFPKDPPEYILVDHLYMPNTREQAALAAKRLNLDGILWIDSDMEWSSERVFEMLHFVPLHPKAVIAFPYPGRKLDMWIGQPLLCGDQAIPNKHGLVDAFMIGFGFTWTPIECFERSQPWFNVEWIPKEGFIGEDIWFTRHLPAKFRVLISPNHPVGHAFEPGPRDYVYDHWNSPLVLAEHRKK